EVVAERAPREVGDDADATSALDAADRVLLDQLAAGPEPARDLAAPDGRAGLRAPLRRLADLGVVTLDWTLTGASAGPRYERWIRATASGQDVAATLVRGEKRTGRPLGPPQVAALVELATAPPAGLRATDLGARHGSASLAGLARRGLVETAVRERPRRPLAERPPGLRGARPPASALTTEQATAVAGIEAAMIASDP